eukprot:Blabericola_migrator_1__4824@NODE_2532_length_2639_cov_6_624806_g1584_i0_p1_GENE_NODE_2532_length_2639_cov_6_624806_g1584_i0NODE_2532_length_2639_cov_6_624806_g1584_i0_p1_ORF_typecomplete_len152_score18_21_NODE_2532_length_2639_cov_6_624806_g1584_i019592414
MSSLTGINPLSNGNCPASRENDEAFSAHQQSLPSTLDAAVHTCQAPIDTQESLTNSQLRLSLFVNAFSVQESQSNAKGKAMNLCLRSGFTTSTLKVIMCVSLVVVVLQHTPREQTSMKRASFLKAHNSTEGVPRRNGALKCRGTSLHFPTE